MRFLLISLFIFSTGVCRAEGVTCGSPIPPELVASCKKYVDGLASSADSDQKRCDDAYAAYKQALNSPEFRNGCGFIRSSGYPCIEKARDCIGVDAADDEDYEDSYSNCRAAAAQDIPGLKDKNKEDKDDRKTLRDDLDELKEKIGTGQGEFSNAQIELQRLEKEYKKKIDNKIEEVYEKYMSDAEDVAATAQKIESEITSTKLTLEITEAGSPEYQQKRLEIRDTCRKQALEFETAEVLKHNTRISTGRNKDKGGLTSVLEKALRDGPTTKSVRRNSEKVYQKCLAERYDIINREKIITLRGLNLKLQALVKQLQSLNSSLPGMKDKAEKMANRERDLLISEYEERAAEQNKIMKEAQTKLGPAMEKKSRVEQELQLTEYNYKQSLSQLSAAKKTAGSKGSDTALSDLMSGTGNVELTGAQAYSSCCNHGSSLNGDCTGSLKNYGSDAPAPSQPVRTGTSTTPGVR